MPEKVCESLHHAFSVLPRHAPEHELMLCMAASMSSVMIEQILQGLTAPHVAFMPCEELFRERSASAAH